MMEDRTPFQNYLRRIAIPGFLLFVYAIVGCMLIYNLTRGSELGIQLMWRQLHSTIFSLAICAIIASCSDKMLHALFRPTCIIGYLSLWFLFVFGKRINGSISWYCFSHSVMCQPAELIKPLFIAFIAYATAKIESRSWNSWLKTTALLGLFAGFALPIALQPDWGTLLVYGITFLVMLFCNGLSRRQCLTFGGLAIGATGTAMLCYPHVYRRFELFFHSLTGNASAGGYHAARLEECLIKGGWTGCLITETDALTPLPYRYSDSLTAGTAELLGALGIIPIVLLATAWLLFCMYHAWKTRNTIWRLIFVGAGSMITSQTFIHLGVNLGILPNTGIPLPLLSYGGSSLLATMLIISLTIRLANKTINHEYLPEA